MNILPRTSLTLALLLASSVLIALNPAPASAAGTTYWVDAASAQCTDTGAGLETAPFCTISAAAKRAVVPGDTVRIRPGTYREQVTLAGSGTTGAPISILGDGPGVVVLGTRALGTAALWSSTGTTAWRTPYAPPSNPRQVLLDGQRLSQAASAGATTAGSWFYDTTARVLYVDIGGANPGDGHAIEAGAQSYGVHVSGRHDVVVSGLVARDQNFAGVRLLSSSAVTVEQVRATGSAANGVLVESSPGSGVVVRDVDVADSLAVGIRVTGSSGVTVRTSRSHGNQLHGIALASSSNNLISGNQTFDNVSLRTDVTAAGIDVNSSSTDNVVENNVTHGNQDSGIQVYNGSHRALLLRNVSYSNGDHGLDTLGSTQVRLVNNTVYGNRHDGISVEGSATGATLANNIMVDNGRVDRGSEVPHFDLFVDSASTAGFSSDYSIAYKGSAAAVVMFGGTQYKKLNLFAAATGNEAHGLALDPDLVDVAAGDFRPTPGSPAVDSANAGAAGFSATDAAGNALADDSIVPDTGVGSPSYADRGALEMQPVPGAGNYAPHAALFLSPASVSRPPSTPVTADATGSADGDVAGIASYTFDFGDDSVPLVRTVAEFGVAAAIVTHVYLVAGTYQPTLTVADSAQQKSRHVAKVAVASQPVPQPQPAGGGGGSLSLLALLTLLGARLARRR